MGAQRLSARKIRILAGRTGMRITRAWAHGGYTYFFYVDKGFPEHQHGWYDKKLDEWGLFDNSKIIHYTSCKQKEW